MNKITDEKIIKGLREGDNEIIAHIYRHYYRMIKHLVSNNRGNEQESNDVFQEALIIIYNEIRNGKKISGSSFKTYLYSTCKYIWLNQLRRKKPTPADLENIEAYSELNKAIEIEPVYFENLKLKLIRKYYDELEQSCKEILKLYVMQYSYTEIAKMMNLPDEMAAHKRKFLCKDRLIRAIKNDPKFKELTDYENL